MKMLAVHEVVRALIGKIKPVGKTETDGIRLDNLEQMIATVDILLDDILEVATLSDKPEYSVSRAGKRAEDYLSMLYDTIKEYM